MTEPVPAVAPPPSGSFRRGLAAAIAAAVIGAIAWAVITVASDYKIGLVAVGIGVLVGLAVERFGGGDARLPIAAAVIALFGCLLGDLFIAAHAFAKARDVSIFNEFQRPHEVWTVYTHSFGAIYGLFYAIAAFEGFQFGRRGVRRAQAAAAAHQPPSIEVPGSMTPAAAPDHVPAPADPPIA